MNRIEFHDMESSEALLSHVLFKTNDIDEACAGVAKVFSPHQLRVMDMGKKINSSMHHVSVGDIALIRLCYGATVDIDPGVTDQYFLIEMPLTGESRVKCGTDEINSTPRLGAIISPTLPLHIQWRRGCEKMIVRINRQLVERHLTQHLGHKLSKPVQFQLGMELGSSQVRSLRQLVELLVNEVDGGGPMLGSPIIRANVEQMLIGALLFCQPSNYMEELRKPAQQIAPYYVKRAEEYIDEHPDDPISIVALAEHLGVSTRALFAGFQNFRGVSPHAYIKSVRLERVRKDLLAAPPQDTVTSIAMRWGFTSLGHFASDYKKKFGESPSQTLRTFSSEPNKLSFGPH